MSRVLYCIEYNPPIDRESRLGWIGNFVVFANYAKQRNLFIESITVDRFRRTITCSYRINDTNVPIEGNEHLYQLMEAMDTIKSEN